MSHRKGLDSYSKNPWSEQWELLGETVFNVKKDFLKSAPPRLPPTETGHLRPQRAPTIEDSEDQMSTSRTEEKPALWRRSLMTPMAPPHSLLGENRTAQAILHQRGENILAALEREYSRMEQS